MDDNADFVVTDSDQGNSDKNLLKIEKRPESEVSHRRQRYSSLSGSGTSLEQLKKIAQF